MDWIINDIHKVTCLCNITDICVGIIKFNTNEITLTFLSISEDFDEESFPN